MQDFVWELAHKGNHALIPAGASAPTLHEGFIVVFVFLKAARLKVSEGMGLQAGKKDTATNHASLYLF